MMYFAWVLVWAAVVVAGLLIARGFALLLGMRVLDVWALLPGVSDGEGSVVWYMKDGSTLSTCDCVVCRWPYVHTGWIEEEGK